jgi:hypothetical protein
MSSLQANMHAMQQELKLQHCSDLQLLHARSDAMAAIARAQTLELLAETSAMQQELKSQQCSGLQILHARYDAKAANARAQSLEQQAEGSVELCEHLAARLSAAMLLERKQAALLSGLESAKQQAEHERNSAVSVEQASFRHAETLSEKLQAAHEALRLCESLREAQLQQLQLSLDSIQMLQEQLRVSEREREERERGRESVQAQRCTRISNGSPLSLRLLAHPRRSCRNRTKIWRAELQHSLNSSCKLLLLSESLGTVTNSSARRPLNCLLRSTSSLSIVDSMRSPPPGFWLIARSHCRSFSRQKVEMGENAQ